MGSREIRILMNYKIGKSFNREIMYCALSIIHSFLGLCPKPHLLLCLDAKKYAKKNQDCISSSTRQLLVR